MSPGRHRYLPKHQVHDEGNACDSCLRVSESDQSFLCCMQQKEMLVVAMGKLKLLVMPKGNKSLRKISLRDARTCSHCERVNEWPQLSGERLTVLFEGHSPCILDLSLAIWDAGSKVCSVWLHAYANWGTHRHVVYVPTWYWLVISSAERKKKVHTICVRHQRTVAAAILGCIFYFS